MPQRGPIHSATACSLGLDPGHTVLPIVPPRKLRQKAHRGHFALGFIGAHSASRSTKHLAMCVWSVPASARGGVGGCLRSSLRGCLSPHSRKNADLSFLLAAGVRFVGNVADADTLIFSPLRTRRGLEASTLNLAITSLSLRHPPPSRANENRPYGLSSPMRVQASFSGAHMCSRLTDWRIRYSNT